MEAEMVKQIEAIARQRRDENEALTVEIVCAGPQALKIFEMMSTVASHGEIFSRLSTRFLTEIPVVKMNTSQISSKNSRLSSINDILK